MFKIDIKKHVSRLTPPFWRRLFLLSWMEVLLYPIAWINEAFILWVSAKRIELTYNGQTIHLERCLNDLFDPTLRRIKIQHSSDDREFDYLFSEGQNPDFDYLQSETSDPSFNKFQFENSVIIIDGFLVIVPTSLSSQEDKIRGNVLKYRLATVNYDISFI